MKLLRVIASTLLLFLVTAFSFQAGASDLTREEKIKRIMSVAEKAKEPRNFYRWQSETSGNNLLAAGEYNEKLFNYFMTMTIDEAHFAGGRGVYYAENITSSAQFIRGDGKGSLIEVRIPKGMPTLDLTNQKTLKKLEQLGITTNDVLFLDPPLAVRYSSSGWWAVKRREGVKFQPFNVDRLPLSSLLKDLKALKDYPRAAEVLEVHLTQRAEKEVAKNAAILVQEPRLQGLVSKRTLERAISKSKDLQQYYAEKFKSDQYADLPGNHFGTIVSTARKLGFEIDESKMFANLTTQQKLSFLDEVYPAGSAPEATLNALLNDENVKQTSFQLKPDELKTVERHLLPLIQKRPDILVESARAYHLLSIENLVSLLQKNPKLVQHFTEQLKSKYLDLPIGQDVGPVLMGFRAAGVDFNEQHIFTYMEIPKRLQFLNHFYPDRAPPRELVDMLVSNEGLRWATTSPFVTSSLTATLSRIAEQDAELLIRNPISFQYVNSDTLEKVLAGNQASRDVLHAQFESGKFSGINEKALLQLRAALAASGKPVSEEGLFRNLDLDAKLAFLQKKFTKNKISVPHTYYHALLEDQTIQRNGQISDASLEKLGQYANDALHEVKDDVGLINKATRLFGFGKIKPDGRALIGYELRSKDAQNALSSYVYAYLNSYQSSGKGAQEVQAKALNSLVAARFKQWDHAQYKKIAEYWRDENLLTDENRKILEEEIVKDLVSPTTRDKDKVAQWARQLIKEPSDASAAAIFEACSSYDSAGIQDCWKSTPERVSLYDQAAGKVFEKSPDKYIAAVKSCLGIGNCWTLATLHRVAPPQDLSLKQARELMSLYKDADSSRKKMLQDNMIEIVAKHWRQMPDDLLAIFEDFRPGTFWNEKRTEALRVRRAFALSDVAEGLLKELGPNNLKLARTVVRALSFDEAHERYLDKPNYDLIYKVKRGHDTLGSATFRLEDQLRNATAKVQEKVPVRPATAAVDPVVTVDRPPAPVPAPVTAPAPPLPTQPPVQSAAVAVQPPAPPTATSTNSCATLFQKLTKFLKTRGR